MSESNEIWHFEKVTNRKYDVIDNSGEQVCRMVLKRPEGVNSKTNCSDKITGEYRARLISAAPDLLEALEAMLKEINYANLNQSETEHLQNVEMATIKAIYKARGKQ